MYLWDRLEAQATGMQRVDRESTRPHGPGLTLVTMPTAMMRPMGLATQREYEMRATVSVVYWANPAQERRAAEEAKRQLAALLYADFLVLLTKARAAVWDNDFSGALAALGEIDDTIMRGRKLEC